MPEALLGRRVQVSDMTPPAAPLLGFVKEPRTSLEAVFLAIPGKQPLEMQLSSAGDGG